MVVSDMRNRGKLKRVRAKAKETGPRDVALIMFLRDGGVKSYYDMALATGLSVSRVIRIMQTYESAACEVKCRTCGGIVVELPCQACINAGDKPRYFVTKPIGETPKQKEKIAIERAKHEAEIVNRMKDLGMFDLEELSALSGLTEDQVLEVPRESLCEPDDNTPFSKREWAGIMNRKADVHAARDAGMEIGAYLKTRGGSYL